MDNFDPQQHAAARNRFYRAIGELIVASNDLENLLVSQIRSNQVYEVFETGEKTSADKVDRYFADRLKAHAKVLRKRLEGQGSELATLEQLTREINEDRLMRDLICHARLTIDRFTYAQIVCEQKITNAYLLKCEVRRILDERRRNGLPVGRDHSVSLINWVKSKGVFERAYSVDQVESATGRMAIHRHQLMNIHRAAWPVPISKLAHVVISTDRESR